MTLLCLAAVWLAGFGLVRWLFPQPLRWSLHNVLLFSLGIGAGAGIASCLYFVMLLLSGPSLPALASAEGAALAIAVAAAFFAKRKRIELDWSEGPAQGGPAQGGPATPWYLTALFLLAAALALTMFIGAVAYNPHGDEGAWSIWNLRARFLVRGGAFWRDAFSNDLAWTRPDYPLLLPGLVALCWKLAGHDSTDAPIAIAFLFALGAAGVLVSTLGILRGRTQALLAGTLLLGTASFVALSAALYGDVPLSFYILATVALLALQDRHPGDLRFSALAGLMAGFAAWTRNEGAIFVAAVILARAFGLFRFGDRSATLPQLVRFLAGLAAPLAVVVIFKLRVAAPNGMLSMAAPAILKHLADPGRWITMLEGLVAVLFTFGRFLIPIVLALALYWYLVRFRVDTRDRAAVASASLALALTLIAQLLVDILYVDNLPVEIGTSFERILLQLWPAALMIFFQAAGPLQLVASEKELRKGKPLSKAGKPRAASPKPASPKSASPKPASPKPPKPGRSVAEAR
jgi:hypothetical protein